jgi:eukaryotic-like serine/threonine-protein kinase
MTTISKAGRYEIVGELGRGAMGVVYKAMDPVIGRTVAVKTIRLSEEGTGLSRPELLTRFQTEARAAGLLTHPNIVVVFDAGEEDGLYYITMELVEGKSLQALIDSGQGFPLPRVLRIMEQTCSALQFAHERNVVHRDIKPANLMLTPDDTVKVTDFGTAKILQFGTVQQTAHVMGTPSYMSPEQVKGRAVDGRSDIFSLGVLLYEILTGEKPFPGQSITTVIYKIVNEEPVPPKQLNPSIHPGISSIVMKALAKDPDLRYQSCREMLDDLKNYRTLGSSSVAGNPDATLVAGLPKATMAMKPLGGTSGIYPDDSMTALTAASLSSRTVNPMQTPSVRRTGGIAAFKEPEKKSVLGTVIAATLLLIGIVYGGYKLRPVFEAVRAQQAALKENPAEPTAAAPLQAIDASSSSTNTTPEPNFQISSSSARAAPEHLKETAAPSLPQPPETKPVAENPEKAVLKKPEIALTASAAEYKRRIEEAVKEKGLGNRLKVQGVGNTLTLAGKLHPSEYGDLLKFLRGTPADVRVVDHIENDTTLNNAATGANSNAGQLTSPPTGLLLSSRPAGADVFVAGMKQSGQTPLTIPLKPGQYNLVIRLQGYDAYVGNAQVNENSQTQLDVELKERATGHVAWADVSTDPKGAEILVDGTSTGQYTPARVQIQSGFHNVVLRLNGYFQLKRSFDVSEGGSVSIEGKLKHQ